MIELVRKYNFTEDQKRNGDIVGCVFDWFEVRVKGTPLIEQLEKVGYKSELDKGCATHNHYYECERFSISWDIKSSYIDKTWSHVRIKNSQFYGIVGFNTLVDYVRVICRNFFKAVDDDIIITRIDYAFDFPTGCLWHNIIRSRFENRQLGVDKYTEFHGKVGQRNFTNYSAGCRGSSLFFRLYYKTIENTLYRDGCPKKQYIADWHSSLFGQNVDVVRFEVEFKPNGNLILSDLVYNRFTELWEKYFCGVVYRLYLGEGYQSNTSNFTEKDKVQLVKLIKKFVGTDWHHEMQIAMYLETCEQFRDILLNVFNERL